MVDGRQSTPLPPSTDAESWLDRFYRKRNQLVANPRFQSFAARFWPTRSIARHRAKSIFDLCAGFVYSQILVACIELKLLEHLQEQPLTIDAASPRLGLTADRARRLILGAVALGLAEERSPTAGGVPRYGLSLQGAALLGNPGALAMIAHHKLFYQDLADPVALLRSSGGETALSRYWAYAGAPQPGALNDASVSAYSALMAQSQPLVARDVLAAYGFQGHRRLLDIGGGEGAFLSEVSKVNASIELALFDLPVIAERARQRFATEGLESRVTCHGGSFKTDVLPAGADAVSLIRIVHDHDDAVVHSLLASIYAMLPPGGTLLIGEPMAQIRGAETIGDAYFGFYLLAMGSGQPRSIARLTAMLQQAGFTSIMHRPTAQPMLASVLTARK